MPFCGHFFMKSGKNCIMKKTGKVKKKKGLQLLDLFFCFPVIGGILCANGKDMALCQVLRQGDLRLVSFRQKQFVWHHKIPILRGIEFVANGIWVFAVGFWRSCKSFYTPPEKAKEKTILQLFIAFLIFLVFFVLILFFGWIILGILPAAISIWIFGIGGGLFVQRFFAGVVRCIVVFGLLGALQCFASVRALWRFNTAANLVVSKKRFFALNFFNVLFGALLFDTFVLSLLCFDAPFVLQMLLNILCFALSCGAIFEICLWQENKGGIYQKLCAITSILQYQPPSKTCFQVARGAVMECELMTNNPAREEISQPAKNNLAFVLGDVKAALAKAGIDDFAEAEWLVANVLGCGKLDLKFVKTLTDAQVRDVFNALERRLKNEPLEKIFGFTEFYGLRFKVNKSVLTPRPETELLVENVLKYLGNAPSKVLDLCTGSGAIAISIAKNSVAEVVGVDISDDALAVAKRNAEINDAPVKFRQSDMFSNVKFKKFDVIVSNPPYIKTDDIPLLAPEVRDFDPTIALDGGADGLYFYRRIADEAPNFLRAGGKLFLEIGIRQGAKVKKILTESFQDIKILKDYNGIQRIVVATKKG